MIGWLRGLSPIFQLALIGLCTLIILRVAGVVFRVIAAVVLVLVVLWLVSKVVRYFSADK